MPNTAGPLHNLHARGRYPRVRQAIETARAGIVMEMDNDKVGQWACFRPTVTAPTESGASGCQQIHEYATPGALQVDFAAIRGALRHVAVASEEHESFEQM